jgi:uncharacterized repeat protein (TIGR03843 family)
MGQPVSLTDAARIIECGDLEPHGRILPASNLTLLAEAVLDGQRVPCVYKPVAGERPLWDFPDGTLANRERAAYVVSEALGWDVVPLTVLRDGPQGPGMVQMWREPADGIEPVDLFPVGEVPDGFLPVLEAEDGSGRPVSLAHEDSDPLRRMAVFDVVVNNADRKGGHVLGMADGHRYGVDHGVCFHEDMKLRTVLWGWARERLTQDERSSLERFLGLLDADDPAVAELTGLLSDVELEALEHRCRRLLSRGRMPVPTGHWPAIPWPAF